MDNPIDKIYAQLRHYYQLIFLYDLQGYKENDLTSLSLRLEGGLDLDRRERQIHEELISKSEKNVAKRLEEKAKKRQEKYPKKNKDHLGELFVSSMKEQQESQYIQQNCFIGSYPYMEEEKQYNEIQRFNGNFLNGRMIILLPIGLQEIRINNGEPTQKITFQIMPEQKFSQITRATLKQCGIKINSQTVTLIVAWKNAEFRVVDGDSNILGLNYLRKNNIITKGNYRSQQSIFTMIFTE